MKLLTDIKKSRATFDTSETKKEFGPGKKVLSVFSLVESETLKILFKSLAWKIVLMIIFVLVCGEFPVKMRKSFLDN